MIEAYAAAATSAGFTDGLPIYVASGLLTYGDTAREWEGEGAARAAIMGSLAPQR